MSKSPDWSMKQSSFTNLTIDETESFQFLSFFFWIHITFQYLGIVEGKQFKLYLSLTCFQCSDIFLSFFTGEWPSQSRRRSACFSRWLMSKNWRFFFIFLQRQWHFGAKSLWTNHSIFPSSNSPSGHAARVT